jgi:transcription elongation factor Elf1
MESKPYEQFWNIQAEPLELNSRADMRCIFCNGKMEVSHGVYFEFELTMHGPVDKKSHAMDTWVRCQDCGYTNVHGVAINEATHRAIERIVQTAPQMDPQGKITERDADFEIEEGTKGMVFPFNKKEPNMKPGKPAWDGYENIVALVPKFDMTCKMCGNWMKMEKNKGNFKDVKLIDGQVPLVLRHSRMHKIRRTKVVKRLRPPFRFPFFDKFQITIEKPTGNWFTLPVFRISYKCPVCDWLPTFIVPVPQDYWDTILGLRKGEPMYYPPLDEWGKEADYDLVKEKLESLGYV